MLIILIILRECLSYGKRSIFCVVFINFGRKGRLSILIILWNRFIKHIDHVAHVVLYIPNEFVSEVIAPSLKLWKDQENFLELSRETELKESNARLRTLLSTARVRLAPYLFRGGFVSARVSLSWFLYKRRRRTSHCFHLLGDELHSIEDAQTSARTILFTVEQARLKKIRGRNLLWRREANLKI